MRASQKGVSGANATTKASPFESEIYPSHKSEICTLCISPLQGAKDSVAVLTNANAFVVMPDTAMSS